MLARRSHFWQPVDASTYKRDFRNCQHNASCRAKPHDSHNRQETDDHLQPSSLLVFRRKLKPCNNKLHADDDPAYSLVTCQRESKDCKTKPTKVMSNCWSLAAEPHCIASRNLAANGPKMMPIATAGTIMFQLVRVIVRRQCAVNSLTGFSQVPLLLYFNRYKSIEDNEGACGREIISFKFFWWIRDESHQVSSARYWAHWHRGPASCQVEKK